MSGAWHVSWTPGAPPDDAHIPAGHRRLTEWEPFAAVPSVYIGQYPEPVRDLMSSAIGITIVWRCRIEAIP